MTRQQNNLLFVLMLSHLLLLSAVAVQAKEVLSDNSELTTHNSELVELFRIRIDNVPAGEITVSKDKGTSWEKIGSVLKYCEKVQPNAYTASKWVEPVHVAATSVNAIHITTDYNPETDRGTVFSLLPKEVNVGGTSYLSPQASISTDMAGGSGIFGGGYAPLVGNPVWVERWGVKWQATNGYVPEKGDRITIIVQIFADQPTQLVFENREQGLIWLQFPDGSRQVIGYVVRPVHGVGRFTGGYYAEVGRIRANHAGVIDISCSPLESIGGFQIVPLGHAYSPEMKNAWKMTQWMIVAPLSPDESWEGVAPLFYQYLRPDYRADDAFSDNWRERLLSRFLVEVKHDDGLWSACPTFTISQDMSLPLPEWANTALDDVTAIRILFPVYANDDVKSAEIQEK